MMGSCTNPRTRNPLTENGYPLSNCHSNGNNDDRPSIFQSTLSFKSTVILLYYGCENRAMALFACQPKHAGHWDIYGKYVYVSKYVYIYTRLMQVRGSASRITGFSAGAAGAATSSQQQQPPAATTHRSFDTEKSLHRRVFTCRSFYTERSLYTGVFTHRSFYTEMSLH